MLLTVFSYDRMLSNIISHFDSRSMERVRYILGWIAFSKRPLKKFELLCALALSAGDPFVEDPVPSYVLDFCAPLVEERPDTSLSFIHVSVRELVYCPCLR